MEQYITLTLAAKDFFLLAVGIGIVIGFLLSFFSMYIAIKAIGGQK